MSHLSKTKYVIVPVLLAALVWVAEAIVEAIFISGHSFVDALYADLALHEIYMRLLLIAVVAVSYLLFVDARRNKRSEVFAKNILNGAIPICITDTDFKIITANDAYRQIWGDFGDEPVKCYENRPGPRCHTEECPMSKIVNGLEEYECVSEKKLHNETRYFLLSTRPFLGPSNKIAGIIESFQDITKRKILEEEKVVLIEQLQESIKQTKQLSGLLPVCSACKKIRDDDGYWRQIEGYIRDHSEADFTHGICPDCMNKVYPEYSEEE